MNEEELFNIVKKLAKKTIQQLKNIDKISSREMAEITAANCIETVQEIKDLESRS